MSEVRVGWAKREITPARGYGMSGYIARHGASVGVLDPLYVRVLLLEQDTTRAAIVLADVLLISSRWADRLRQKISSCLQITPECVVVAATHTHSGPILDMYPFAFTGECREPHLGEYSTKLEGTILAGIRAAQRRLKSAIVSFAKIEIDGVATDRNRRGASRRQSFFIFRFDGPHQAALFAVFGCHPTVLGADNRKFSGDLHGEISRILEKNYAIALVANGAAGNISTRFIRKQQSAAELKRLAAKAARQVSSARFRPLEISSIKAHTRQIVLPLSIHKKDELPSRPRLTGRASILFNEGLQVRKRLSRSAKFSQPTLKTLVTMWRIGSITIAALPWEIYSDTGKVLWKQRRIAPLCYANGYWGYLPSAAATEHDYEVLSSPFTRAADRRLRQALVAPSFSRRDTTEANHRKRSSSVKGVTRESSHFARRSR
jgi:neutral/alkaline ceramidase-like enzyme